LGSKFSLYADWACEVEKSEKRKMLDLPISRGISLKNVKIESSTMIIEVVPPENTENKGSTSKKSEGPGLPTTGYDTGEYKPVKPVKEGVAAMVEGTVRLKGGGTLELDVSGFFKNIADKVKWFENWKNAGKVPEKIVYEGLQKVYVKEGEKKSVGAGYILGIPGKTVEISIYYSDGAKMNPIEFFNLLFWQEEYDPVYKADYGKRSFGEVKKYEFESWADPKTHALIDMMMGKRMDGSEGTPKDDDWMGLRPPLRTYKRVEWEAKRELLLYFENWQQGDITKQKGDITNRIKTPNIIKKGKGEGYMGDSKCNILAGELAYRAGFRTFVKQAKKPEFLKFWGPNELVRESKLKGYDPNKWDPNDPEKSKIDFGKKLKEVKNEEINKEISELGKCFIYARKGYTYIQHVVILNRIDEIKNDNIEAMIIDQHCKFECPRKGDKIYLGCSGPEGRAFIDLLPGDDPQLT
jgi:hypothetical protein